MSDKKADEEPHISLSADDFEAALRLLEAEEQAQQVDRRALIANFIAYIATGVLLIALPLGLLIVWFDAVLGWSLLGAALLAFIVVGVSTDITSKSVDFDAASKNIRGVLGSSGLGKRASASWEKRSGSFNQLLGCLSILGGLVTIAGLAWLVYGLFWQNRVILPSLVLASLPVVVVFILIAIDSYREFRYFSHVSQLQSRFQKASAGSAGDIPVSSADLSLLARVEKQQVERGVSKATHTLAERLKEYSVTISPEPLARLKQLSEQRRELGYTIRGLADSLQTNPRPADAHAQPGAAGDLVISREEFALTYKVDDARQRVVVLSIRTADLGKVDHDA